jgi:hypothetical protein
MSHRAWTSAALLAACGLALGACSTLKPKAPPPPAPTLTQAVPLAAPPAPPPPPLVVRVPVPVKEACVPKSFPRGPKYPDSDAALRDAGGAADRYQLMAAGRLLRERRLAELEKLVDGCR